MIRVRLIVEIDAEGEHLDQLYVEEQMQQYVDQAIRALPGTPDGIKDFSWSVTPEA